MRSRLSGTCALSAIAAMTFAGPALASGGNTIGGGSSGGGTGTVAPAPSPTQGLCIGSLAAQTGTVSGSAAIWTQFTVSTACGTTAKWTLTFTNDTTGAVEMTRSGSPTNLGAYDFVRAAYTTTYTVTLAVNNSAGTLIDIRSLDIATHGGAETP